MKVGEMGRLQIIVSRQGRAGPSPALPPGTRFGWLKAILATIVLGAAATGVVIASLFLGSVIAAFLIIAVTIVILVVGFRALLAWMRR